MVHYSKYHANKAKIMQPVDEFLVLLNQRTQGAIAGAQARKVCWLYAVSVLSFCLLATVLVFWYVYQQIASSLQQGIRNSDAMAAGDLAIHNVRHGSELDGRGHGSVHKAVAHGVLHHLRVAVQGQLAQDACAVRANRLDAQAQLLANLGQGNAACDHQHHLHFAR